MKKLKKLPPPLRKQALLRFAGAGACFCLLLLVAVGYCQPMLWFPFLVMGAFSAGSGALLVEGGPRKGPGRGRRLQRSGINPVSLPAQGCGDGMRRPTGQGLSPCPRAESGCGERLRIYVAESAPVYEEDDILVLSGYLAVEVGKIGAGQPAPKKLYYATLS